ncbi:MAG TPA: 2-C-methyl-D-erythritol 2,4-cyclodiphosphate synthase [Candidatus Moranbacteria bacterium]|nr:2-C-methyl-D-erythritol 2,4-cyclodiphosphate synthase [Candidatus Moranbacteria bacterium]
MFNVGLGKDSHRFIANCKKPLMLGGVVVDRAMGVEANSDGDLILHALCDALEQASGGNSFDVYASRMCEEGITDSREYLKVALANIKERDYCIHNIGVNIEGKRPKIMPLADEIRGSLSQLTEVNGKYIGINATTGEGLTAFGRGEGMEVIVIVTLKALN